MSRKAWYSVWRNSDDRVIMIDGTPEECSKAMGISRKTFFGTVSRVKSGINRKWHIEVVYTGTTAKPPKYASKRVQAQNVKKWNEYERNRRIRDREKTREKKREWYAKNKDRINEKRRKERADANRIREAFGDCERDAPMDLLKCIR